MVRKVCIRVELNQRGSAIKNAYLNQIESPFRGDWIPSVKFFAFIGEDLNESFNTILGNSKETYSNYIKDKVANAALKSLSETKM